MVLVQHTPAPEPEVEVVYLRCCNCQELVFSICPVIKVLIDSSAEKVTGNVFSHCESKQLPQMWGFCR